MLLDRSKCLLLLSASLLFPMSAGYFDQVGGIFGNLGHQMSAYIDTLHRTIDSWSDHVIRHARSEDCTYYCLNGSISKNPVPNTNFKLVPKGCAAFGLTIKDKDLPMKGMRVCCDDHQMCYHECRSDKVKCDSKFEKCLLSECTKKTPKDNNEFKACITAMKMMVMGVLTFGCKTFKDAQQLGCSCPVNDEL